VSDGVGSLGQ